MDFKSLKRQRDGKAKRGDVKAKAAALRQAKLEAEAAARRDAEKATKRRRRRRRSALARGKERG